jgi:hypothetical protein
MPLLFDRFFAAFDWRPIRNCPGRFVVSRALDSTAPTEVVAIVLGPSLDDRARVRTQVAQRPGRDGLVLTRFTDESGGLLSYVKSGSFVHTLNAADGWVRKLSALGIEDPW